MSASAGTAPADIAVARGAREVFARATGPGFYRALRPGTALVPLIVAVGDLGKALEFYELILAEELCPAAAYEELLHFQPDELRYAEALRMAAEEAAGEAAELVQVTAEHVGDEAAAMVSGQNSNNGGNYDGSSN